MLKLRNRRFVAYDFPTAFLELLANKARTLDMRDFENCLQELKGAHESKMTSSFLLALAFFGAVLWAAHAGAIVMAILMLGLALTCDRKSSHHMLFMEIMEIQRWLAMLLNKQSREIEALGRQDVTKGER